MDAVSNNMILYAFTLGFEFRIWEEWTHSYKKKKKEWTHKADLRGYANLRATKFVSSDIF